MKYLKYFDEASAYEAYKNGSDYVLPNVSYVVAANCIYYEAPAGIPNNEIWYTSSDGDVVTPNNTNAFGANITSNTYSNGKGVITFDGDVTTIGGQVFANCSSLTSITIPDSVTSIEWGAFSYCGNLTSVTIGDGVTTIGFGAFTECSSLQVFNGKFAEDNGRILVVDGTLIAFAPAGLTEYTIPNSVTTIRERTFYNCTSLTSVTIGNGVTSIGSSAFNGCNSLASVTIPDSITEIGEQAFQDCSFTSVTIPDSVTKIGNWAFRGCLSLTSVYCKATTPPSLKGNFVFDNNGSGRKIYVPAESVDAYKRATYWKNLASAIVDYNF